MEENTIGFVVVLDLVVSSGESLYIGSLHYSYLSVIGAAADFSFLSFVARGSESEQTQ